MSNNGRPQRRTFGSILPHRGRKEEWLLMLSNGRDADGKRVRKTKVVKGSRKDAEREFTKFAAKNGSGIGNVSPKLTVRDYLIEHWLAARRHRLRDNTAANYEKIVNTYFDRIGSVRLAKLTPIDIDRWLLQLRQRKGRCGPLTEKTILNAYGILRCGLRQAVRWRLIDSNPIDAVEPPKPARTRTRKITATDARALLNAFEGHWLEPVVILGLGAGLRRGEALGLRWGDVDLEHAEIHVEQALTQGLSGAAVFGPPKSERSRRTVSIPIWLVEKLRDLREAQVRSMNPDADLVCARPDGSALSPRAVSHGFTYRVERAGLAPMRLHDCRHGYASLLLSDGESIGVISDMLGHSTITITKDLYAEASREAQRRAAGRLDVILGTASELG